MITFSLVDVKNITTSVHRSEYQEADLDEIADLILKCGGLIKPLILKASGVENYTIVDGHLEYFAAVRAKEKDRSAGEMVNAFIVASKNEEVIVKQAQAIRDLSSVGQQEKVRLDPADLNSHSAKLESRIERIEKQINNLQEEQAKQKQELENKLKQIENQIPKKIEPLEAFNTLSPLELTSRLRSAGISDKQATKIVENVLQERKKEKFGSLKDVVERVKVPSGKKQNKGISSDTMLVIIDTWSRTLFV